MWDRRAKLPWGMPSKEFNETLALLLLLDNADDEENDIAIPHLCNENATISNSTQEAKIKAEDEQLYMSTYDFMEIASRRDSLVRIISVLTLF